jgi:hypothetical protein
MPMTRTRLETKRDSIAAMSGELLDARVAPGRPEVHEKRRAFVVGDLAADLVEAGDRGGAAATCADFAISASSDSLATPGA